MSASSSSIRNDKFIRACVTAAIGTIASLWTNCIFVISLQEKSNEGYSYEQKYFKLIFQTIQYEYVVICLIAVVTLIWGVTKSDRKYLIPWFCLKFCENIAVFFGTALIHCKYVEFDDLPGLIPLGLSAIAINVITSVRVYKEYRRMLVRLPLKNLKNIDCQTKEGSNEDETVEVKVEELNPLCPKTNVYIIPPEKYEKF